LWLFWLKYFFGQGFHERSLPSTPIEVIAKGTLNDVLNKAARGSKKKGYDKGKHSFELLAIIDPEKITQASPWARRFVDELRKRMDV